MVLMKTKYSANTEGPFKKYKRLPTAGYSDCSKMTLSPKIKQVGKKAVIKANYYLGSYKDVIWLVGDGRSGTTWVSNLINWQSIYREMFEPFHPELVSGLEAFQLHQYIRPDDTTMATNKILSSIFSGRFYHERPDALNRQLFYKGLLIKDIFANLIIGWVTQNLPHVKSVLVIRNPFAVALSKQKRTRGIWMSDPNAFLSQKELVADYVEPFRDIIEGASNDFIERQLIIWSIIHYVPFKQLALESVYILFYEDLFNQPEQELSHLFQYLFNTTTSLNPKLLEKVRKPSRTPGKDNNILLGKSPIDTWKDELSSAQIDRGMAILEKFALEKIYGTSSQPNRCIVEQLLSQSSPSQSSPHPEKNQAKKPMSS